MAEKVKVSREVGDVLDYLRSKVSDNHILSCAGRYKTLINFSSNIERVLAEEISMIDLAKALINGYEFGSTSEEILLERFNQNNENRIKAIQEKNVYQEGYALGYSLGVQDGLNFSNKKVKGINE